MERIGLIGGVSWVSTMEYYRRFNLIAQEMGAHNSADLVVFSLNFRKILKCQRENDTDGEFNILLKAALELERSGVSKILICSNTTSNTCDRLEGKISVPVINIIDATVSIVKKAGYSKVGLLGTKYVMERGFYIDRFQNEGVHVAVPREINRSAVHNAIYDDLCLHNFSEAAKTAVRVAIDDLVGQGVEVVILGCTELPLIVDRMSERKEIQLIDSIDAHIAAALSLESAGRPIGV